MDATDRRQRAAREAAEWYVRLESDLAHDERALFVAWLQESPIHVGEMIRLAQVHGALENFGPWGGPGGGTTTHGPDTVIPFPTRMKDGSHRLPAAAQRHVKERPHRRRRAILRWTGAVAAVALLALTTALVMPKVRGQLIETERGERREVVLNDGSMVLVDPETSMRVKYRRDTRQVFLNRGRALFRVAKNPNRPFLVEVDATTVRAVGTAFGVDQQDQGVIVTVVEGKVAVDTAGPPPAPVAPPPDGAAQSSMAGSLRNASGPLFLTSDQQVTVPRSGAAATIRSVDSRRELAWAEGRLVFHNLTVGTVVGEFNRYNRVQLEVTDRALAERMVSGVFNASDPESFISFLQTVAPVAVTHQDERTISIASRRAN